MDKICYSLLTYTYCHPWLLPDTFFLLQNHCLVCWLHIISRIEFGTEHWTRAIHWSFNARSRSQNSHLRPRRNAISSRQGAEPCTRICNIHWNAKGWIWFTFTDSFKNGQGLRALRRTLLKRFKQRNINIFLTIKRKSSWSLKCHCDEISHFFFPLFITQNNLPSCTMSFRPERKN